MYECPASIAPEPNKYISSSIFLLANRKRKTRSCPLFHFFHFQGEKFRFHKKTQKSQYLVLHVSVASVIVVFIYSGVRGGSPLPLLLIVCQSSPEAEDRRLPSPSRRLLAGDQNRKLFQPIAEQEIQVVLKTANQDVKRAGQQRSCKYNKVFSGGFSRVTASMSQWWGLSFNYKMCIVLIDFF